MHSTQLLVCGGQDTTTIFTPWMHRLADNAVLTYEIVKTVGNPTLAVDILHKAADDTTSNGSSAGSVWSSDGSFRVQTVVGLKEMIRLKITLSGGTPGAALESVLYRFLEPTWGEDAEGSVPGPV